MTLKPLLLCSLLALAGAADVPFLLPPGAQAGAETSAGSIPLPATDASYSPEAVAQARLLAGDGIKATLTATTGGKNGQVQATAGDSPALRHNEQYDDKGVLTFADTIRAAGFSNNFYGALFGSPGMHIEYAPGKFHRIMALRYVAGARSSSATQAQLHLIYDVPAALPFNPASDTPHARLSLRLVAGKDGWTRALLRLDEGKRFHLVAIQHDLEESTIVGRQESFWVSGQNRDFAKVEFPRAEPWTIDAKLPGVIWHGSGKNGAGLAAFGVISPATAPTIAIGKWNGPTGLVGGGSAANEYRFMIRTTDVFAPAKDIAEFARKLPELRTSLEATPFLMPAGAIGLALSATERIFIERLIADGPALGRPEAIAAAKEMTAALARYDSCLAAIAAAKTSSARLAAEEEALCARARLDHVQQPIAELWVGAGGVPAKKDAKAAKPTDRAPGPALEPDVRYDLSAPAFSPDTTRWYGDKPVKAKPSVLVLYGGADYWEQHGRKMAELKRALGIEVMEYAMCYQSNTLTSRIDDVRIRNLLASRRWDVILAWNTQSFHGPTDNIGILPADIRAQIYRAVMDEGTGLLLLATKAAPEFCRADRLQPADGASVFAGLALSGRAPRLAAAGYKPPTAEAAQQFANAYYGLFKAGKGVAVSIDMRDSVSMTVSRCAGSLYLSEMEPWKPEHAIDGDYFHAEMARLLWRAAGVQPDVAFIAEPGVLTAAPGATAAVKSAWRIRCAGELKGLTANLRIRGLDGAVVESRTLPLTLVKGEAEIPLVLPNLGAGVWYADVFVDSARGRENFGYASILVPAAASVQVRLDPVAVGGNPAVPMGILPGGPLAGSVELVAGTGAAPAAGSRLRVQLRDEFGRVLASQQLPAEAGKAQAFSFATTDIERIPLAVEAALLSDAGVVLATALADINLLNTHRDRFHVSLAGGPTDPWQMWTMRSLWRQGVTMLGASGESAARANLGSSMFSGVGVLRGSFRGKPWEGQLPVSMQTLYHMDWDEKTGVRSLLPAPWNDAKAYEDVLDMTNGVWERNRHFPTPLTVLYDEGSTMCADTSAPGMKAWQDWLKAEYKGDIAALNREWNSSFKAFTEITETTGQHDASQKGDPFEYNALVAGNVARWSDRHVFANHNYADLVLGGWTRRAQRSDPGARIGLSGTFNFHNFGLDYDVWLKRSGFWAPYSTPRGADGLVLDLIRSNAPKGYPYSYWIGYTNGTLLPLAWDMVFKGATGVWWFQLPGDGTLGWLGRNDVPYAQRQELIDQAILPLRRGLGDLLIRLDQQHDRIALYYSPQTALASGTEFLPEMKGPGLGREFARADNSAAGAVDLIRDSGREFLYLTKGRVLAGDLQKLGIKLLLLPMIQPLGEDEVAALRTFASAGGVIVADLRPGVLSGRIRPIASGPADALFGITRSGAGKAKTIEPSGTVKVNGQALTLALGQVVADSELAAAGATAALTSGGVPLLLENKVGSGAVWLLNAGFDRYPGQRTTAIGESWRSIFAGLSARAGLPKPLATMATAAGGNPLARLQVWNRGGVSIYGVLDGEGKGSLTLAKAANLFDLRKGSLGKGDKAAIEPFAADTAHFIAAYDYDPGRPTIAVGKPEGAIVTCAIAMSGVPAGETGTFSYHTRLLDPQGTWVDVIPWSVQGAGGKAELRIRFALNDAAGNWSLAVREVTTGRETTVKISRP